MPAVIGTCRIHKQHTHLCIFTMPGSQIIDIFVSSDKAKIVNGVLHFLLMPERRNKDIKIDIKNSGLLSQFDPSITYIVYLRCKYI